MLANCVVDSLTLCGVEPQDALGELVACGVVVAVEGAEFFLDAQARAAAEVIYGGQHVGVLIGGAFEQPLGTEATGGDREDFGADLDETAEQKLLPFEFRTVADHRMKEGAAELAAHAGGETEMTGQNAWSVERGAGGVDFEKFQREPLFRIPFGIETGGFDGGTETFAHG